MRCSSYSSSSWVWRGGTGRGGDGSTRNVGKAAGGGTACEFLHFSTCGARLFHNQYARSTSYDSSNGRALGLGDFTATRCF